MESWRQQLIGQKATLDSRMATLKSAEDSKWITYSPMGIVDDIEIYLGLRLSACQIAACQAAARAHVHD